MHHQLEMEERLLEEQLERGQITREEYNQEHRELMRDYRIAAEEAAQNAYDEELRRW